MDNLSPPTHVTSAKASAKLLKMVTTYNEKRIVAVKERNEGRKKIIFRLAPFAVLLILGVVALYIFLNLIWAIGAAILGIAILAGVYFWQAIDVNEPAKKLRSTVREQILPLAFPEITNLNFEANVHGFLDKIPTEIMPSYDKGEWGDLLEGNVNGRQFAINELELIKEEGAGVGDTSNDEEIITFKGIAIRASLPRRVKSKLVVRNKRASLTKWVSTKTGFSMKEPHVPFDDANFKKQYDVHCSNAAWAKQVFSDDSIVKFTELQSELTSAGIQLVAAGKTLTVMIEQSEDFFELPSIDKPLDAEEDITKMRGEVYRFLNLIEKLDSLISEE